MKRSITALSLVAIFALAGCANPGENTTQNADGAATDINLSQIPEKAKAYDLNAIKKVDEIATLVPQKIAESGKLQVGAACNYAPAEFFDADGKTPVGYEIDLNKAIGKVLGLESVTTHAEFPTIIPSIGSKFDIGMSSFTITSERLKQMNMISFINVGSQYAVATSNSKKFDPKNVCGLKIGVQTGTYQQEQLEIFTAQCTDENKKPIQIVPYENQGQVTTNVVGGKLDAMLADSTIVDYAIRMANGQLSALGEVFDSAPQGIVISKNQPELTQAVQKAVQHLMDDGTWATILDNWGTTGLSAAELNPTV